MTHEASAPPSDDTSSALADEALASPVSNEDAARVASAPDDHDVPADDPRSRKERVLHTRVPGVLEDELKRLATSLRVPVSNVVRAILEDAVEAADRVSRRTEGGIRGWSDRIAEERVRLRERVVPPRPAVAPTPAEAPATETAPPGPVAPATPVAPLAGVLGFQPLFLATSARCVLCGRGLDAGDEAFLGIREVPGPRVLVGRECLPGRAAPGGAQGASEP